MRYVPINCIREGMRVGKKLLGKNGELLLNAGAMIYHNYIEKIKDLGYGGLYVEDELSQDIEIIEVISEELRYKSTKTIKDAFLGVEKNTGSFESSVRDISAVVNEIVNNVLDNRDTMINVLDLKTFDDYTYLHSVNVAVLSLVLGVSLNFNKVELYKLGLSSILHDIGKVFIPKAILNKPEKLNPDEFTMIQTHANKGYTYLKNNYDIPMASYLGVLQHHEKFNGTGYPVKLEGLQIHLFGRIIAIADVYDALTSNRPYRKAMMPSEAIEYVLANGATHFDPEIVECFIQKISPYPIGMTVRLSNSTTAIIMENYADAGLRPKVKVISQSGEAVTPYILNLRDDMSALNITIIRPEDVKESIIGS